MKTVCAALIVKDEGKVISRCLESIKPYIDYWTICDTGSTDNTVDIISEELSDIPGELHNTSWKNFGHNRTELIKLAKNKTDYILLVDADMVFNVSDKNFKEKLSAHSYLVGYTGELDYRQKMLIDGRLDWKFVGVTHEYLHSEQDVNVGLINGISLTHFCDGSRRPEKFSNDIKLLEQGLQKEPDNARYMFYLAQSYYDTNKYAEAIHWYEQRAEAGGWEEEVYFSLLRRAKSIARISKDFPIDDFIMAYDYRPKRLEALYEVIRYYREKEMYNFAYSIAERAVKTPYPRGDYLFIDKRINDYKLKDELAICAYWVGKYQESFDLCEEILNNVELPPGDRDRIKKNKKFAKSKLI